MHTVALCPSCPHLKQVLLRSTFFLQSRALWPKCQHLKHLLGDTFSRMRIVPQPTLIFPSVAAFLAWVAGRLTTAICVEAQLFLRDFTASVVRSFSSGIWSFRSLITSSLVAHSSRSLTSISDSGILISTVASSLPYGPPARSAGVVSYELLSVASFSSSFSGRLAAIVLRDGQRLPAFPTVPAGHGPEQGFLPWVPAPSWCLVSWVPPPSGWIVGVSLAPRLCAAVRI